MIDVQTLSDSPVTAELAVRRIIYPKCAAVRGFAVFRGEDAGGKSIVCSGYFPGLAPGETVRITGRYGKYPDRRTGRELLQITAEDFRILGVRGPAAVRSFLFSFGIKGLGTGSVSKLTERWGPEVISSIRTDPDKFAEFPVIGVSARVRTALKEAVTGLFGLYDAYVFLRKQGFCGRDAASAAGFFGRSTRTVYATDPYRFASDSTGVAFETLDGILIGSGSVEVLSPDRIAAGIMCVLRRDGTKGHVFSREEDVKRSVSRLLHLTRSGNGNLRNQYMDAVGKLSVTGAAVLSGEGRFFLRSRYGTEQRIAALLRNIRGMPARRLPEEGCGTVCAQYGLSPAQRQAVLNAFAEPVSVITGGPGTGKSRVITCIRRIAREAGLICLTAAPTGKAAGRLAQSETAGSGDGPLTIHRMLRSTGEEGVFRKNSGDRLECDIVIIDEASMVDIGLAGALLSALPEDCSLVFAGDADQLPPVGPGLFFSDLIASSRFPTVRLDTVFRQSENGSIPFNASRIREGLFPLCAGGFGLPFDDFFFFERNGADILPCLLTCVSQQLPRFFALDPVKDILVMTPVNEGPLGTAALNRALRERLNPDDGRSGEYAAGGMIFRTGDRVMQTVNDYELMLFNGDTGFVREICGDRLCVEFPDCGRTEVLSRARAGALMPAYALTVHKAQGSEAEAAVIVMDRTNSACAMRKMLYTAVTRARKAVVLIGERDAFEAALSDLRSVSRRTELAEILKRDLQ